ncbi:maleylpyruvate isomerase family mycothiol-dependent enzyme [Speluncibacter jeojiensis]|uniref:Maleylpyruvate isomerase family mycothiol-dependent enzyme n=1 Tax=Speluncibacter jeojiensis TaxID=2710754 RepID=A0A9X4RE65_9ACTN|nr:maleylpyruvate isomerase family mycothiol-dependent enzyme [Corynebacteriales bacterium D3-21]
MSHTVVAKEAVTEALSEQWSAIEGLLGGLTDAQWRAATALPGWTVHDVVAHLIGAESMLTGQQPPQPDVQTQTRLAEATHVRNEIGALNERWVESMRALPPAELVDRYRTVTAQRRAALEAMTQADFDDQTVTPVGPESYGRFMRIRVYDCWMHELDLRDAVGLPGPDGGPRAALAWEEIVGALGFLVGKRAHAPEGSRITIETVGPLPRSLHVAVDGRAAVVEHLDGPPDVTIVLDAWLFARLTGGRTDGPAHRDDVEILGDHQLGWAVVDNLRFAI